MDDFKRGDILVYKDQCIKSRKGVFTFLSYYDWDEILVLDDKQNKIVIKMKLMCLSREYKLNKIINKTKL